MKKILFIPLDERPCNYYFPSALAEGTGFTLLKPDVSIMGLKKKPGDTEQLWSWLLEHAMEADGAVIAIDTLLYGGIIPSRLHHLSLAACEERLLRLKQLKQINPSLKMFAFQLIMRCPRYSSADEEPEYYGDWGKEIFTHGYIEHRLQLGIATAEEQEELDRIKAALPPEVWQDYNRRRDINVAVNQLSLQLVQEKVIDFMIVPQDDSAPFGLTAVNQQQIREKIAALGVGLKAYMYPGADEVGCTLLTRMINEFTGRKPFVYTHFSSIQGPFVTPLYEDRLLFESVKFQIMAAGGLMATSIQEADMVLCVNSPGDTMMEANAQQQANIGYRVLRNLVELAELSDYVISKLHKPCAVADVAFANGADLELLSLLRDKQLLFRLAGYAGWNTSSNTLGTCIAQMMLYSIYGDTEGHRDFLALRYVEDAGYCSHVRGHIGEHVLPALGLNYFSVDGQRGEVSQLVKGELEQFIECRIQDEDYSVVIEDCYLPWSRMFEVGLQVRACKAAKGAGANA